MSNRFMQENSVPAGTEHHLHLARRAGNGVQIDLGDAQGLFHLGLPALRLDPDIKGGASARAGAAALPPAIAFDGHRNIEAGQRANVAQEAAIGAQNLDLAPFTGDGDADLHHFGIASAGEGVDFLQ